jgi:hypothetical protein
MYILTRHRSWEYKDGGEEQKTEKNGERRLLREARGQKGL